MIVCLEGVDLCGKGTQTMMLKETLPASTLLKFPNALTTTGKLIYQHLDRHWAARFDSTPSQVKGGEQLDALVFQALQTVNRLEQAERIMAHVGLTGAWLVLDRYWPSGVVFGGADGLEEEWLMKIHMSLPQPDLFILLDMDLEHVQARFKRLLENNERAPDRYETDDKVADRIARYRRLWSHAPIQGSDWVVVDARRDPRAVHASIGKAMGHTLDRIARQDEWRHGNPPG